MLAGIAVLVSFSTAPKFAFLKGVPPVAKNKVHVDGPAIIDETVGTISVYSVPSTWSEIAPATRKQLRSQFKDVSEIRGGWGALIALTGADWRFYWGTGAAVGLYRDFKAKPQTVKDPYGASMSLKGSKSLGWTTIVIFDGSIRTKPQYRAMD